MLWVNFKTYEQGTGEKALKLAKTCQEVSSETAVAIIPVVQAADIFRLSSQDLSVWAQHLDDIDFGPNTGQSLAEAIFEAGAKGVILNHSENKLPSQTIGAIIRRSRQLGLKTLVCSESIKEAQEIAPFKPDFLAYEPPELIGGQASVSSEKQAIIKDFVKEFSFLPLVIGAGIHQGEDIKKGLALGAKGFLVSSNIVLAKNPKKKLLDLVKAIR